MIYPNKPEDILIQENARKYSEATKSYGLRIVVRLLWILRERKLSDVVLCPSTGIGKSPAYEILHLHIFIPLRLMS